MYNVRHILYNVRAMCDIVKCTCNVRTLYNVRAICVHCTAYIVNMYVQCAYNVRILYCTPSLYDINCTSYIIRYILHEHIICWFYIRCTVYICIRRIVYYLHYTLYIERGLEYMYKTRFTKYDIV